MSKWNDLYADLRDFCFPRTCAVCGSRLSKNENRVCAACLRALPHTQFANFEDNRMAQCFWGRLHIERATALFYYRHESVFRQILWQLKYNNQPEIGELMGRMIAHELQPAHFFEGIDLLIPVPLAAKRLHERGYNQCDWLAKGISDITHIPVCDTAVVRTVANATQTRKGRAARAQNVQGIFALGHADTLVHKHLLLIDDVMTTGATLISCGSVFAPVEGVKLSVLTLAMAAR